MRWVSRTRMDLAVLACFVRFVRWRLFGTPAKRCWLAGSDLGCRFLAHPSQAEPAAVVLRHSYVGIDLPTAGSLLARRPSRVVRRRPGLALAEALVRMPRAATGSGDHCFWALRTQLRSRRPVRQMVGPNQPFLQAGLIDDKGLS